MKKLIISLLYAVYGAPALAGDALWPIAEGATWTYEISGIGFNPICAPGEFTAKVETVTTEGESVFFTGVTECGYSYRNKLEVGRYYIPYEDEWFLFLDTPVDGHVYMGFRSLFRYNLVQEIAVPAGTFHGCWQVTQLVSYQQQWVYCPGVGKVWEKHVDLGGTGWETKLKTWQIP